MQGLNGKSSCTQGFRDFVDFHAGTGKADGEHRFFHFENAGESCQAMRTRHNIGHLRYAGCFLRGVLFDDDVLGVLEMLVGDFKDALRERC